MANSHNPTPCSSACTRMDCASASRATSPTRSRRPAASRPSKAAQARIAELRKVVADLEDRAKGGPAKRQAAAKKAAATRKRKAAQRSAAAKKAARTRAKAKA